MIEIGTSLLSSEVYNGCCSVAMETLRSVSSKFDKMALTLVYLTPDKQE